MPPTPAILWVLAVIGFIAFIPLKILMALHGHGPADPYDRWYEFLLAVPMVSGSGCVSAIAW